jgi:hypothetical protein
MKKNYTAQLASFRRKLDKAAQEVVPTIVKEAQNNIAYRLYGSLKWYTPVLTGHARHNWVGTLNKPWDEEIEGVFAEEGETHDPLTGFEKEHWASVKSRLMAMPVGQTVWVSNNVPYIQRLENGWSKKAPQGMVKVTITALLEEARARGSRAEVAL